MDCNRNKTSETRCQIKFIMKTLRKFRNIAKQMKIITKYSLSSSVAPLPVDDSTFMALPYSDKLDEANDNACPHTPA